MPEIVMPNQIKVEGEAPFKARLQRYKNHRSVFGDTSVFQLGGRNLVVGKEADVANKNRITGPLKYRKGVLDVMLSAAMLKLLPNGHQNIIVSCAHTTDSVPYIEHISEAIKGDHVVTRHDGTQLTYHVSALIPWDEPAGGLFRFMTRPLGAYNAEDILPGDRVLVVDIGGKISSMMPATILSGQEVEIEWGAGKSFDLGIQDLMDSLEQECKSLHPEIFKVRTIPQTILRDALRRFGKTKIYNKDVDVSQAVLNATAPLLNGIDNAWSTQLDSAMDIRHIIVTGGGGGLLYGVLKNEIFSVLADNTYLAEEPEFINRANLRGGKYATSIWIAENGGRVKDRRGQKPTYIVIDPGNSDIKADLI